MTLARLSLVTYFGGIIFKGDRRLILSGRLRSVLPIIDIFSDSSLVFRNRTRWLESRRLELVEVDRSEGISYRLRAGSQACAGMMSWSWVSFKKSVSMIGYIVLRSLNACGCSGCSVMSLRMLGDRLGLVERNLFKTLLQRGLTSEGSCSWILVSSSSRPDD